jgi:hypothetical protein
LVGFGDFDIEVSEVGGGLIKRGGRWVIINEKVIEIDLN